VLRLLTAPAVYVNACGKINSTEAEVALFGSVFISKYLLQEVLNSNIPERIIRVKFFIFFISLLFVQSIKKFDLFRVYD
jgi:hypothetical protein